MRHSRVSFIAAAACIAAGLHAPSFAQAPSSVTLYGRVDLNLTKTTGQTINMTRSSNSRWGLRGSERVGGGLAVTFQLESAFEADSGLPQAVFFRESWLGLQGGMGTLRVGRSLSPAQRVASNFDPHGTDGLGSFGSTSLLLRQATLVYMPNTIFYETPQANGFRAFASYEFDENPAVRRGAKALSIRYRSKAFEGALVRADAGLPSNDLTGFAAAYDFGAIRPMVQQFKGQNAGNNWQTTLVGFTAPLGTGKVRASHTKLDQRSGGNDDRTKLAVGYDYPMSKRTLTYATIAKDTRVAQPNSNGLELGFRHSF